MPQRIVGQVKRVNGPVITIQGITDAMMMELVHVGEQLLVGELVKLDGMEAVVQVYEDATGIAPGDNVYGTGLPLSVELGPGLMGTIYDGIQRPLERLRELGGDFMRRGIGSPSIDRSKLWNFSPSVGIGDMVVPGQPVGVVQENERIEHKILVPPVLTGTGPYTVIEIASEGSFPVEQTICTVEDSGKERQQFSMMQRWPIRVPRPVADRRPLSIPLITGQRVIDMLFPLAKGGTVAIPGGFGTGKTMTQHAIAQWCDADIIVYIGCGERGNEMTDVLREFPHLIDPRTGRSLMERTILIANTSNMPVSAREASIYTGIT
ncbi:MAG TPA: V-type ATP synthase subunit A, partial [Sphaerochaeta sp.]|nr:V-type ATP synthase subunit A [Sphaerochaeta sp.]